MHNISVKNVPAPLYEKLKRSAQENRRSINNEIIYRLENSLSSHKVDVERLLARLHDFYKDKSVPPLTDKLIKQAKEEGRK